METNKQWKRVPFDVELAKKIQAGEIEGKIIKVVNKCPVRIICWDRRSDSPIVALYENQLDQEGVISFDNKGEAEGNVVVSIEVSDNDEPQFKPFDKVLVRSNKRLWNCSFYNMMLQGTHYTIDGRSWDECIPYEGNEHLVGTTNKPKED